MGTRQKEGHRSGDFGSDSVIFMKIKSLLLACIFVIASPRLLAQDASKFTFAPPPPVRSLQELEILRRDLILINAKDFPLNNPLNQATLFIFFNEGAIKISLEGEGEQEPSILTLSIGIRDTEPPTIREYKTSISRGLVIQIEQIAKLLLLKTSYSGGLVAIAGGEARLVLSTGILHGYTCLPPAGTHVAEFLDLVLQAAFCATGPKLVIKDCEGSADLLINKFIALRNQVNAAPRILEIDDPFVKPNYVDPDKLWSFDKYVDAWKVK